MGPGAHLRALLKEELPVTAPLVLDPLMARMAEKAGFKALYLGGGASGYRKVHLEANLNLTEMVQTGVEIRGVTRLPLILDGACGWGDPMHMHRTIGQAEAAGFAAIEIEDQILPKRAHHHAGIEHMIPQELMIAKIEEAVRARRESDLVIVARTNGVRASSMEDALRRAEAYREAGADLLLLSPRTPEEVRIIGDRLGGPLMFLCAAGGLAKMGLSPREMAAAGFRLIIDAATPLLAAFEAMEQAYSELAQGFTVRSRPPEAWHQLQEKLHATIDLDHLLQIERRTVEH